CVRKDDSLDVW
nr:immunoglobulin heavy chain junction region [Macaca mulatta]